jgi:hypothetical protein
MFLRWFNLKGRQHWHTACHRPYPECVNELKQVGDGKTSLLEVDGEQPKENIAQDIVTAIQSMLRISIAGAQSEQSMLENNP